VIPGAVAVSLSVVGASLAISGLLIVARGARLAGGLTALSGAVVLVGIALEATGHDDAAAVALVLGGALVAPLALVTYPTLDRHHPVTILTVTAVVAIGVVSLAQWNQPEVVGVLSMFSALVLIGYVWWQIEVSPASRRWSLVWMSLGVGVSATALGFIVFAAPNTTGAVTGLLCLVVIGPAMYVGVARPEVVDVRGLVVHAVVFAVAGTAYVAAFMTIASFLEVVAGDVPSVGGLAIVGLLVAVTFRPMQVALRGVVDELLFGHRPDPLDAATGVVGAIGDDPVLALRAIREALVLPYAALRLGDVTVAESGSEVTHTRTIPLGTEEGDPGGALVIGLRPGDLGLSEGDRHVLGLVAPLLAQTLRANQLAVDLQASREATVTVLEEERRRLRRDLHDGLGPRLSGIAFTSDAARNSLRSDPDQSDELLAQLRTETGAAIDEIRRLVYAMRPPALDELGLVPALRQQAGSLRTSEGAPLRVSITTEDVPDEVAAAVEVAAYRIVMEALTNVARHSGSDQAEVGLHVEDAGLVIDVVDAGTTSDSWSTGVGIASMRERAAQLGGSLTASSNGRGGRVHAILPLS
jgi:signal transduction histidine kinase